MTIYKFIFKYFQGVDKAIKCSIDNTQIRYGIVNAARKLQNSLSNNGRVKIIPTFSLDGKKIYLRELYFYCDSKEGSSWSSTIKSADIDSRFKELVPVEVYVTIDGIESIYSIADFMLLEGFLCLPPENKS